MFKQLCKHNLFRQPIFTPKTYNHAVTYNHASADGNLRNFKWEKPLRAKFLFKRGAYCIHVLRFHVFSKFFSGG